MIPTKQNVLDAARFHLADDLVSGGQVFTNTVLEQPFNFAVRELYRALQGLAIPRVQREAYYDLPINTTLLVPSTAGITDLGEVEVVETRGMLTSVSITNAVAGNGFVTVTAAGHPFTTGNVAVIFGVLGISGVNGMNAVTVVDSSTFKVNGAVGSGTYTAATGTATLSVDRFVELTPVDRIDNYDLATDPTNVYAWVEDTFKFQPSSQVRELRITYISSAATIANTTDTVGIDDALDFLAVRTAGFAAASRGARDRAGELNAMAIGPDLQADGTGGILRELVCTSVRALQQVPTQRPPFRQRGNPNAIIGGNWL